MDDLQLSDKMARDLTWIVQAHAKDMALSVRQIHVSTLRALKQRGLVEYKAEDPWHRIIPTEAGRKVAEAGTFNVYNDHGSSHIILPTVSHVDDVRDLAAATAKLGHPALYRVFRQTPDSITREKFEVAFSVLGGKVTERRDVTIPKAHWR